MTVTQTELYDLCDQLKRDVGHWDWKNAQKIMRRLDVLIKEMEMDEEQVA